MDVNSDLSLRSTRKSRWFNLKYLLLFLNMMLVYINSGLFFYLFTKDLRKTQNSFKLKDYPNLRYTTQMRSGVDTYQTLEEIINKSKELNEATYSIDSINLNNRLSSNNKYRSLDEMVRLFGQQEKLNDNSNLIEARKQVNELKRADNNDSGRMDAKNKVNMINNDKMIIDQNQLNIQETNTLKKNKTLVKKPNYNELNNLNKQLSLVYLLLGFNNFLNFICLTRGKTINFLLFLPFLSIFTILPLIITKSLNLNFEINLWLFIVHLFICILTFIHVKRLKKSTSEQITSYSNQLYRNHHFVSIDSNLPTSTNQQFLMNHDDSCKSSLSGSKDKSNLISSSDKKNADQQILTPALKKMMNFKKHSSTPPPNYDTVV